MNNHQLVTKFNDLDFDNYEYLIISVSGGVDSMTLLDVARRSHERICAVFFDHQTRTQINDEYEMVSKYCQTHDIVLEYVRLNIKPNTNFQSEARRLRYYHLKRLAKEYDTPTILTGHQLNDFVESHLMRAKEKSDRFQMDIFHYNDFLFVKPFLLTSKAELYEYAKLYNVPFMEDKSNFEPTYFRNKVRQEALDLVNDNPDFVSNLVTSFLKDKEDEKQLYADTINYINNNKEIDVKNFLTLSSLLQESIIKNQLIKAKIVPKKRLLNNIKKLYNSKDGNRYVQLSKTLLYYRSYDKTFILDNNDKPFVNISLHEGQNLINNKTSFTFFTDISQTIESTNYLCYNKLVFPLIVRNRLPGDILMFKYGTKKLKNYLIDEKIPQYLRDDLIVICDSNQTILFVLGLYKNEVLGNKHKLYYEIK